MLWYWRQLLVLSLWALAIPPVSHAQIQTKILSVNGHAVSLSGSLYTVPVSPGDVVNLVADDVDYNPQWTNPLGVDSENFIWSSDFQNSSTTDYCDPLNGCGHSNFDFTATGVNYYVPRDMGPAITITAQNRYSGSTDQIILANNYQEYQYRESYQPDRAYYEPDQYPSSMPLDYNVALAGQGQWVTIGSKRVFAPYSYTTDWQPYSHGYWYWTSYGWTWMSYDPWGWVTDHYGYWRHHRVYGWVWTPFGPTVVGWQPAVVTFFDTASHVAWSPYWDGIRDGYREGYADGYDDGFWDGYRAASQTSYRSGVVCVESRNFMSSNIVTVRTRADHSVSVIVQATNERRYGRGAMIYGRDDRARVVVERAVGRPIQRVELDVSTRRARGPGFQREVDIEIVRPRQAVHRMPQEYARVVEQAMRRVREPARTLPPAGSVIQPDGRVIRRDQRPDLERTPPTRPGRGVVERPGTVVQPQLPPPYVSRPRDPGRGGAVVIRPGEPAVREPVVREPAVPRTEMPPRVEQPRVGVPPRAVIPPRTEQPPRQWTRPVEAPRVEQPPRQWTPTVPPRVEQPRRVEVPPRHVEQPPRAPQVTLPPRQALPRVEAPPRVVSPPPRVIAPPRTERRIESPRIEVPRGAVQGPAMSRGAGRTQLPQPGQGRVIARPR